MKKKQEDEPIIEDKAKKVEEPKIIINLNQKK